MITSVRSVTPHLPSRRLQTRESARGQARVTTRSAAASPSTPATGTPATPAFQSSLWDAFSGTPAPASSGNSSSSGTNRATTTVNNTTGRGAQPQPGGRALAANGSLLARSTSAAIAANTIAANNDAADTGAAANEPVPNPQPISPDSPESLIPRVSAALLQLGLDPAKFNMRLGTAQIDYPAAGISYAYPLLYADINGQSVPFSQTGSLRNPGLVAVNIANMMGQPTMILPAV